MGSAPARAHPAWAAALLWCARAVPCLQTNRTQKHWEKSDEVHIDLPLFPHLICSAPCAGPVALGPNLLSTPIPLAVLFPSQFLSLSNSSCYLSSIPIAVQLNKPFFFFIHSNTTPSFSMLLGPGRKSLRTWLNGFDSLNSPSLFQLHTQLKCKNILCKESYQKLKKFQLRVFKLHFNKA